MDTGSNQGQATYDAAQSPVSSAQQRTMTQDEVNYLTSKVRAEAFENGKREAEMRLSSMQQSQAPAFNADDLIERAKVEARAEAQAQMKVVQDQYVVSQMVNQFRQNEELGKEKYGADFVKATSSIDFAATPAWIPLLNSMPNAHDVMFEISKDENDSRFSAIHSVLISGQRDKAESMLRKFADSLNKNQAALAKKQDTPEPLDQLKPSTATVDGKEWTQASMRSAIRDLRAKKKGRG